MPIFKRTRHNPAQKRNKNRLIMENITIIATIPTKEIHVDIKTFSDNQFLHEAKQEGNVYTLSEFQNACNRDEFDSKSVYIRVLEVSKSSFRLV